MYACGVCSFSCKFFFEQNEVPSGLSNHDTRQRVRVGLELREKDEGGKFLLL